MFSIREACKKLLDEIDLGLHQSGRMGLDDTERGKLQRAFFAGASFVILAVARVPVTQLLSLLREWELELREPVEQDEVLTPIRAFVCIWENSSIVHARQNTEDADMEVENEKGECLLLPGRGWLIMDGNTRKMFALPDEEFQSRYYPAQRYRNKATGAEGYAFQYVDNRSCPGVYGAFEGQRRGTACLPEGSYTYSTSSVVTSEGWVQPVGEGDWILPEPDGVHHRAVRDSVFREDCELLTEEPSSEKGE